MNTYCVLITGFFTEKDCVSIREYSEEIKSYGIGIAIQNWASKPLQASFDYMNVQGLTFVYELLSAIVLNGCYDVLKAFFLRIWRIHRKRTPQNASIPFTISIENIPTVSGPTTINCKINGDLPESERAIVIDKTIQLAEKIEKHQFQLLKTYYTERTGHLFRYDPNDKQYQEVDFYAEVLDKIKLQKENTHEGRPSHDT